MESTFRLRTRYRFPSAAAGFNPCFNGINIQTLHPFASMSFSVGFNPCFNGINIQTCSCHYLQHGWLCFNPCFNGINIQTHRPAAGWKPDLPVSILVLMESTFRLRRSRIHNEWYEVSILVLMESTFRRFGWLANAPVSGFNPCFNGINIQTS